MANGLDVESFSLLDVPGGGGSGSGSADITRALQSDYSSPLDTGARDVGGGDSAGGDYAAAGIGAGASVAGTIISAASQSSATDDARKTAMELSQMRRADEMAALQGQVKLQRAGTGLERKALQQQEKEFDLETRHKNFMRAFKKGLEKQADAHQLMDSFAGRVYQHANLRGKMVRRWNRT